MILDVLKAGAAAIVAGVLFLLAGFWAGFSLSRGGTGVQPGQTAVADEPVQTPGPAGSLRPAGSHPSFSALEQTVTQLLEAADTNGGVSLTELGGPNPQSWSHQGDQRFAAASTYKLPLLMQEAQNVAAGRWRGTDSLCYQDADWEDGYYGDYDEGLCLSRAQLEHRVGQASDNTAAHILMRYDGGASALNTYARAHGAQQSAFYDPNTTTTNDLARLWVNEATGRAGGKQAQQYLYPMLTRTQYEKGIPAGVAQRATVVHKIGILEGVVNDAALVQGGPRGVYVLAVCTEGPGGDAGWALVAAISRAVWQFEATR
jgi:beta-lactamase class A